MAMGLHVFPIPIPPPSLPDPSGSSQCTRSKRLSHVSNLGWWYVSPLIVYMFRCCSLETSHSRLLPQSLKDVNDNSICRTEKETQIYRTILLVVKTYSSQGPFYTPKFWASAAWQISVHEFQFSPLGSALFFHKNVLYSFPPNPMSKVTQQVNGRTGSRTMSVCLYMLLYLKDDSKSPTVHQKPKGHHWKLHHHHYFSHDHGHQLP